MLAEYTVIRLLFPGCLISGGLLILVVHYFYVLYPITINRFSFVSFYFL